MVDLNELLERVSDRESFLAFVRALIADWDDEVAKERPRPSSPWGSGATGWGNGTIGAYLERGGWAIMARGQAEAERGEAMGPTRRRG